ncbi:uncharacterized protein LOC129716823 [Wyeomyia smithii]|uniref:uncharacterized protein LOC129716823 n=1 Tax=Wyeomyia smithii TaxID=174621 RepID=UPI0024680881|nr:uncharacterized protein LOC129716823 [Wyeomyia smithii]
MELGPVFQINLVYGNSGFFGGLSDEFFDCGNNQGKPGEYGSISYFSFFKCTTLCSLWVKACSSPELTEVFQQQSVQGISKRKICSKHFSDADFRDVNNKQRGLKFNAVPHTVDFEIGDDARNDGLNWSGNIEECFEVLSTRIDTLENPQIEFIEGDEDFETWYKTFGYEAKSNDVLITNNFVGGNEERLRQALIVQENIVLGLHEQIRSLRRHLFAVQQTNNRRLKALIRNKRLVSELRKELKLLKKAKSVNEKLGHRARLNPVIHNSLRNFSRNPKSRRYHPETIKFASGTYLSGPRTYRFVRKSKHLILPHKNTVYGFNKHIRIQPGLNKVILSKIKKHVRDFKKQEHKIVTICLDGISIKPDITYCAKTDTFFGFPHDGENKRIEKNDPSKLATEAIVIMTSGIYRRFKQPIGYLMAHNSLGSETQLKFIRRSIDAIRDCGLKPLAHVMDQCTTNQKMIRDSGGSVERPILDLDGEQIAVIFNTPHLIKSARNALFKHNAVFDGKIASFKHIKQLFDVDVSSTLRLVPRLNLKNIVLPPFSKMNVPLAVRTLSESCSIAINHYVASGELPEEALQTSTYINIHDKLFDTFNSKERSKDSARKLYRTPITETSIHMRFLEKTMKTLRICIILQTIVLTLRRL